MDTIVEAPNDGNSSRVGQMQDINNLVDGGSWNSHNQGLANNSTLLYIAVEYVKDFKIEDAVPQNLPSLTQQTDTYQDFNPHVSPLDPNMSSVARYSPVYSESATEYNPVVIHQLVTHADGTVQNDHQFSVDNLHHHTTSTLQNIRPTVLGDVPDQYLNSANPSALQLHQADSNQHPHHHIQQEQEVELLITDEATGISYSVNAQELLVDRCLRDEDDQQLLESVLAPDPLLDESELLTSLDATTLKSELHDDIDISTTTIADGSSVHASNNYDLGNFVNTSDLDGVQCAFKIETRKRRVEMDPEEQLLSCVYSITDKPILTRARASLPESYLVIGKQNENDAVFARKMIPKRSQFGPLEGVLLLNSEVTTEVKQEAKTSLLYLVVNHGIVYRMDVSDENTSNWMSFVRKAETFEEQNMVIMHDNNQIYFVTTKNIMPKQELKVGYSASYAQYYDLPVIFAKKERTWPCFECDMKFTTSEELQNHLNIHDDNKDENTKPNKKKNLKYKKRLFKKYEFETVECTICHEIFIGYNYHLLKNHLREKHDLIASSIQDNFSLIVNFCCDTCDANFRSESLLKIHNLDHDPDDDDLSDDQQHEQLKNNHICPSCQRKFPTQKQLITHVKQHALPKSSIKGQSEQQNVRCPLCHKLFAFRERLQKHMLVHGSNESKPIQCKTCNKRFLNNSALSCHVKTHFIGKKVFECPICKETFDNVLKLKAHVPKHCNNNVYTCPHCKKTFKKYSIIRKHIRAFHCDPTHNCPHCSKMFPTLDKLRMHLLRHSDHREFLCADCGKQFKRKDKLKEHCKRIHSEERENALPTQRVGANDNDRNTTNKKNNNNNNNGNTKKLVPKVEPTDFHRFIYKCHACLVGFKRRGMLVNHLAKRHPDIPPDSVPELNLPILQTTRDYYCQYCDKVYKSSSKRKAHILKNHPGAELPMSNRRQQQGAGSAGPGGSLQEVSPTTVGGGSGNITLPNPTFSQTVGSITTRPQNCKWCHKQYASKAKLLQHQRKKHQDQIMLMEEGCGVESDLLVRGDGINGANGAEDDNGQLNNDGDGGIGRVKIENVKLMMNNNDDNCGGVVAAATAADDFEKVSDNIISHDLDDLEDDLYRLLTTNNGMLAPR